MTKVPAALCQPRSFYCTSQRSGKHNKFSGIKQRTTPFQVYFNDPFLALVYIGSVPFFVALYQAFKVLGYIKQNKVFSSETVKALRTIKYSALTIIGFVVVEEVLIIINHGNDDAAGGVFMGILITFGSIVVATVATLFEQILLDAMNLKSRS